MIFLEIKNTIKKFGRVDYKGIDINHIVAGSALYINENDGSVTAYLAYEGEYPEHEDITRINGDEYDRIYESEMEKVRKEQEENPSAEQEIQQLKLAMAEMAEAHEQEKTEMQLALAELAELVGGEATHG